MDPYVSAISQMRKRDDNWRETEGLFNKLSRKIGSVTSKDKELKKILPGNLN
jgi:hypothetical protein